MRNFLRLAAGVDVVPLLAALQRHPELWDANTLRTKHPHTAHAAVSDIWLWFNPLESADVANDREVVPYPAWWTLSPFRKLVLDIMNRVEGIRLGRVIITRLPPGKAITPHVDGGAPVEFYTRYQFALQNPAGSIFRIDDEKVWMQPGELWQIDNSKEHEVVNGGADDRIVLICDVRSE